MTPSPFFDLPVLVALWVGISLALVLLAVRRRMAGLTVGFVVGLSLLHVFGAFIHTLPWNPFRDSETTATGFSVSFIGLVGFAIGNALLSPHLLRGRRPRSPVSLTGGASATRICFTVGVAAYLLSFTPAMSLPSAGAVLSVGQQLVLVGFCLLCWQALRRGEWRRFWLLLAATLSFPLFTLLAQGFLGFGAMAMATVVAFASSVYRPRWHMAMLALVLGYAGVAVFTAYMANRSEIRSAVWGGLPLGTRLGEVATTVSGIKPISFRDEDLLNAVEGRLNQNILVGTAVEHTRMTGRYADGETIWMAVLALVPRALWPGKPVAAGSMDLVSEYTGLTFAYGTSVGLGIILELYINFRNVGVLLGCLLLGLFVGVLDRRARQQLDAGDVLGFVQWFLPGLPLLNVGGSLVEMSAAVAAACLLTFALRHFVNPRGSQAVPRARAPRRVVSEGSPV
ncbi:MAG TPA: hypothetical protein VD962_01050 [Rubricoccaceae bacterium]|nr:hypothetical protein [Rubricoccaceae bacterium]